jgi:hypothetical protein
MLKKSFGFGMAIALVASIGIMTAAPGGSAASAGTTCAAPNGKLSITPGLSTTPAIQTINISLPVTGCKGGGVTGGTSKGTSKGTTKQTCATYFSAAASTGTKTAVTISWTPKSMGTSTFTATTKSVPGKSALTASLSGKITKGLFLGKTVTTTVVVSFPSGLGCKPTAPVKTILIKGTKPLVIK